MYINYINAIDSIRKEINSWKFRFLTIFGKVTVIKTLCIPKLIHVVAFVPNPSVTHLRSLESELKFFVTDGNPNVVDETTRRMAVKNGGFGVPNINNFLKAIRMSWLRRSIGSDSTLFKLHHHEVFPDAFDPSRSNFESVSREKSNVRFPSGEKFTPP